MSFKYLRRWMALLAVALGIALTGAPAAPAAVNSHAAKTSSYGTGSYGTGSYGTGSVRKLSKRAALKLRRQHRAVPLAHAAVALVQLDSRTWAATPSQCSCVTTIDGYLFIGMSYIDAVNKWFELYRTPGYVSNPPITSISTTTTVSGTVGDPDGGGGDPPN